MPSFPRFLCASTLAIAFYQGTHAVAAGSTSRLIPIAGSVSEQGAFPVDTCSRPALVTNRGMQVAAYFDADNVVLAKRTLGEEQWEVRRTMFRVQASDLHRFLSIAVDGAGVIHAVWGEDDGLLNYARAVAPGALELTRQSHVTAARIAHVSSPQFLRLKDGDLVLIYRSNEANERAVALDRYDITSQLWRTVQPKLVDGEGKSVPYCSIAVDRRGSLHLTWTWRDSPADSRSHDIAYARSDDAGLSWRKADDSPLELPLTDANCDYAARVPLSSGLPVLPSIGTTNDGHPWIAGYWSRKSDVGPQFHLLRFEGQEWVTVEGPVPGGSVFSKARDMRFPPVSQPIVLLESPWQLSAKTHLVYRDDTRGSHLVASTYDHEKRSWSDVELTGDAIEASELTYDEEQWRRLGQMQVLFQEKHLSSQEHGAGSSSDVESTSVLVWSPAQMRSNRDRIESVPTPIPVEELRKPLRSAEILALAQRVADWQWAHMPDPTLRHPRGWEIAPFYIGLLALDRISPDRRNRDAVLRQAKSLEWAPHAEIYHADDHCVIQAYLELYEQLRYQEMIAPSRRRFDEILSHPPSSTLDWNSPNHFDRWSWCDALFMAPNAWLMMSKLTGDRRYLDYMDREWWATSDKLFCPATGLYFRDESYLDLRESNGKAIHWSRGNGWVFAGLARVLERLEKNHPHYIRYLELYRSMATAVLSAQQPDGLWRSGLLDPDVHTATETSGSSFLTFGLAWGINHGAIDPVRAEPAVRHAWNALARCVTTEGKLEHVQPVGEAPGSFDPQHTEPFAVGAFLLAATELYEVGIRSGEGIGGHNP